MGYAPTMERDFRNYNDAIRAALDWLRGQHVQLDEAFESRPGGFGMRSVDRSGGYRVEFDDRSQAHINVWSHGQKGPHYKFPGNEQAVRSIWRQLYYWDPKLKRRSQEDQRM
jgi:hypothetical protein